MLIRFLFLDTLSRKQNLTREFQTLLVAVRKPKKNNFTTMNPALEYIDNKPEPYRSIMLHLQILIETAIPEAKLKYKWHLPFYYLEEKTMFCFFNFRKSYVDLGMTYGNELSDQHDVLVAGEGRKMVRSLRFETLEDINDQIVMETLKELKELRLKHKRK